MSQSVRVWCLALAVGVAAGNAFAESPRPWDSAGPLARPAPPGTATPDRGMRSLSLAWVDVAGTAPWAFSPAAGELSALLGRLGIRLSVRWVDVHAVTTASELTVILLPQRPAASRLSPEAMGATSIGSGSPRTVVVFAADVARTLGLTSPAPSWSMLQRLHFGVALGRVVVHELVHVLIPAQPHVREGLMAATLSGAQLRGPTPPIAPATAQALRSALGEPLPSAPASPSDVAQEGTTRPSLR